MSEESLQEKTEPATQHKRDEARKKGQVARSTELNSFALLFFGALFLLFAGPKLATDLAELMRHFLSNLSSAPTNSGEYVNVIVTLGAKTLLMLAPTLLAFVTIAIIVNGVQVGFQISPKALEPKFDKLNLAKGAKRLFSKRSLVQLVRDVLKLAIIGTVAYFAVDAERDAFMSLTDAGPAAILSTAGWGLFRVAIKIVLALFVLAVGDYAYQKFDFENTLKMSKHEVKEEMKQHEGSPQIRSRIRQVQRELARMRMTQEIPKADVVVTNPTHLAVALKYDPEAMAAPTVLAKGARLMAEKIKEIAREANIPIVENKPLARAIYGSVEIGGHVPAELYKATAEILAYVYRLRNQGKAAGDSAEHAGGRAA